MDATATPSSLETTVDRTVPSPQHEVLREITRGGLAGLIVGVVVAGVGGRLVMRLAALLVPSADGAFTENGNASATSPWAAAWASSS